MDNCLHGVDARNACVKCALAQAHRDADEAERKLHQATRELVTLRAARNTFVDQLTAADALADWLGEALDSEECAPWPKVREALRAYRAARGK